MRLSSISKPQDWCGCYPLEVDLKYEVQNEDIVEAQLRKLQSYVEACKWFCISEQYKVEVVDAVHDYSWMNMVWEAW